MVAKHEEVGGTTFVVRIRLLNGDPIAGLKEMRMSTNQKVDVLTKAIAKASGTALWQLFFKDRKLLEHVSLYEYGMVDGDIVNAVITREGKLQQTVWSILNTMCPKNWLTIVERLATISLDNVWDLELVISSIVQRVLSESHYCETYANMIFELCSRYPEFPPLFEGEKPHTFKRILLDTCQNSFEMIAFKKRSEPRTTGLVNGEKMIPANLEHTEEEKEQIDADELQALKQKQKSHSVALMKFIGHLFLRKLLAFEAVHQILFELIGEGSASPEEHLIECACEFLHVIGYTLDGYPSLRPLHPHTQVLAQICMNELFSRLLDLKRCMRPGNGVIKKPCYSKSTRLKIQRLIDRRQHGWDPASVGKGKGNSKRKAKGKGIIRRIAKNTCRFFRLPLTQHRKTCQI